MFRSLNSRVILSCRGQFVCMIRCDDLQMLFYILKYIYVLKIDGDKSTSSRAPNGLTFNKNGCILNLLITH